MIGAEIMIAAISCGIISALVLCPGFLEAFTGMVYSFSSELRFSSHSSLQYAIVQDRGQGKAMATVLVADDERNMRLLTAARLDGQYKVLTASDGEEALDIIHKGGVDLVVADIMMPHMDGYELLRRLRNEGYSMPFLFLTAKESLEDKERGFSLGTDDYITKPFSSDELLWRIKALLRRTEIAESRKIRIGSVTVDSEKYAVYNDTEYIEFPKKEFDLLFRLLSYPDQIFSKEQLLENVWGYDSSSGEDTVKTHISRIRNKLAGIREFSIITIKGLGYKAVINEGGK